LIFEYFFTQAHIHKREVGVESCVQSRVDLVIQVKAVDDALPNDPIEVESEALLEKIRI
jgi:hypothetical protein